MKCCCGLKIFFILMLFTQLANAKSPCNKLATTAFFNSSLAPIVSTPDSLKDANAEMADGETFCKRLVQAVKTKKTTSGILRKKRMTCSRQQKTTSNTTVIWISLNLQNINMIWSLALPVLQSNSLNVPCYWTDCLFRPILLAGCDLA